jgi:hypothetical protein
VLVLTAVSCADCDKEEPDGLPPGAIQPDIYCPGGAGCPHSDDDALYVGAAKRDVTPTGWEIAKVEFLTDKNGDECLPQMEQQFGLNRCGSLHEYYNRDCGNDQICPENFGPNLEQGEQATDGRDNDQDGLVDADDRDYRPEFGGPGPDADGSESDGVLDYFWDCGLDRLCPGNVPESGAEATDGIDNDGDGAVDGDDVAYPGPDEGEGDGEFQGLWISNGDNRPAFGIKDPMWVRTMVFKSGETTVAILALDAYGFFYNEVLRIRAAVAERLGEQGADVDYVMLSSTHTHEVPDTLGMDGPRDPAVEDWPEEHGRLPGFNAFIVEQAADSVIEAVNGLQRAELRVAETRTGYEGFYHDGEDPQIIDDRLLVVQAVAQDGGATIGTLVNWANHPEILGFDNNFSSSDYAHALRQTIEEGIAAGPGGPAYEGLGGVALYQVSMAGGLMAPNKFDFTGYDGTEYPYTDADGHANVKTFERNDAYGENIAVVALAALADSAETVSNGRVSVRAKSFQIPVDNLLFHLLFYIDVFDREFVDWDPAAPIDENNRPKMETEVSIIEIGPITLLTVPGEGFPESAIGGYDGSWTPGGLSAITTAGNPNPPDVSQAPDGPYWLDFVDSKYEYMVTLANDQIGYLVPPWRFELDESSPWWDDAPGDHYCETMSLGIESVPRIEENLRGLSLFPFPE